MITLDTNVLLRYIVKDDPEQAKIAEDYIASHECLLLSVVILETVWVLESAYGYTSTQVTEHNTMCWDCRPYWRNRFRH